MAYTLGIDIGGTNFRIGLVDEEGGIHQFEKQSSAVFRQGDAVARLGMEIETYLKRIGCRSDIVAAAIGVPSMVSKDKKTIYSTPNLKGFDHLYFGNLLAEQLGFPVYLDRDVNFLLENDMRQLGLLGGDTVLGFYIGTGFGNAIYMNGRFYCGKNGAAGELGHIPLYGVNETCTCGNLACSEVRCSGRYLEHLVAEAFPQIPVREIFIHAGDDPRILKYVDDLAIPIATEINILDPDYCVLAGGVVLMPSFPKERLTDAVRRYCRRPYPASNLSLLFSKHTQESGVLGAGAFAHKMIQTEVLS